MPADSSFRPFAYKTPYTSRCTGFFFFTGNNRPSACTGLATASHRSFSFQQVPVHAFGQPVSRPEDTSHKLSSASDGLRASRHLHSDKPLVTSRVGKRRRDWLQHIGFAA